MAPNSNSPCWDNLPIDCRSTPQWVLWKRGKREGKITKIPIDCFGNNASSTDSSTWCSLDKAQKALERGKGDGVGFVFARSCGISGVDLDNCRDPQTGKLDDWAKAYIDRINSYTEVSPSGKGIHCIIKGSLPEGVNGRKKTFKGHENRQNAAIEIYSSGRFFTMTGDRLPEYPTTVEDRQDALTAIYDELFCKDENMHFKARSDTQSTSITFTREAGLTDNQVVDKMLSSATGGKIKALFNGDTSAYGGDDSAADQALCNYLAFWTGRNHDQMDRIFRKSKLIRPKWDEMRGRQTYGDLTIDKACQGTSEIYKANAPTVQDAIKLILSVCDGARSKDGMGFNKDERTKSYKDIIEKVQNGEPLSKKEEERGYKLVSKHKAQLEKLGMDFEDIRLLHSKAVNKHYYDTVSIKDPIGTIGTAEDGTVKEVIESNDGTRSLKWLSDCPTTISIETAANNETEFTFEGVGAKDKRRVHFTMLAADAADGRKFKAAMVNAFGAGNKLGELKFEMVQGLTRNNTKLMKRIEIPIWNGNIPLLPGVGLADNVEYKLSQMTPAEVYDGDIEIAKDCLRRLLALHKYAPIVITAIFGAPAYARWFINDRFGIGLWGSTGSLKTSFVQAALSVYGTGYLNDEAILKHGKAGATQVAALEIFVNSGFLPQLLDNVKTVDEKDSQQYISEIQAVIEGREKQRGKKDGGLRDSRVFACTPIITGEIRPEEASTTARVLNLTWNRPMDLAGLTYVQQHVSTMPVIGYHWLRFLSETDGRLMDGFNEERTCKMNTFNAKKYTNPGRLATIYVLLRTSYDLLCESPFGDVFLAFKDRFISALDEAIEAQGATVTEETEVEKFLIGLAELIASNPEIIQGMDSNTSKGEVIGKYTKKGLFLMPELTLNELREIRVFTQKPSVDSMTKALHSKGLLVKDGGHLKYRLHVNLKKVRGWMLDPIWQGAQTIIDDYGTSPEPQQDQLEKGTGPVKTDNGMHNGDSLDSLTSEI
jgi:putative DNA primase/helicase